MNDSNDSIHSSKFTAFVVVHLQIKKKYNDKDKNRKQSKHTTFYRVL